MKRFLCLVMAAAMLLTASVFAADTEGADVRAAASGLARIGGSIFIADSWNRAVWELSDGKLTLIAGRVDVTDASGRTVEGYYDGSLEEAAFSEPWAVVPYEDGLLISDSGNDAIRYIDLAAGKVYTAANSRSGLSGPTGLAVDDDGVVYIADTGNNVIRVLDGENGLRTYAGGAEGCALGTLSEVRFSGPTGLCWADGVLYVADTGNHRIVAISDGEATLVAGAELSGDAAYSGDYLNGEAEKARFSSPQGIAVEDGAIYVADTGNGAVRVIEDGYVTTLARLEDGSTGPVSPRGLLVYANTLYVGDVFSRTLLTYSTTGEESGYSDVAQDAWYYDAVRFVSANGLFEGTGEGIFSPDAPMTRAMILTVLARYDGVDTSAGETWYGAGAAWAVESGVSDGTALENELTREQLVTMLYRYTGSPESDADLDGYGDADAVSGWALEAMSWAVENGVIDGVEEGTLAPGATASRAQVAAILMRFIEA